MKIEKVNLTRKHKLADYEMLIFGFEATVTEEDNPLDAVKTLDDLAEMYVVSRENNGKDEPEWKPDKPQILTVGESIKKHKEQDKGVVVDLETLEWQDMPPTDKGAWQKSETKNNHYYAVKKAIEEKDGKPVFMDGYIVWLNSDGTLGRRKK